MSNDIKVEAASDSEMGHRQRDASRLRVAIFSDALPARNGAGAYYDDLAVQLGPQLGELTLFQPVAKKRFLRFALPTAIPGFSAWRTGTWSRSIVFFAGTVTRCWSTIPASTPRWNALVRGTWM